VALVVLVLEKDRGRLFRYEEILAALGYEPIGFTTLREVALADAARARFDAALLCHQPGTNSLHDIAPSLPIILVTPSARDLDAPILVTSGISEVVHDPVTSGELAGALSRCLNSRNERLWDDRSWQIVLQNSFWNSL
jgi:CheY-like chemotaxis protein